MTKEDIKEIAIAINDSQKHDNDRGKMIDWLFKALIAVIVWIGIGLKNDVDMLKNDVSIIANDRAYSQRDMDKFKTFIEKPRFTDEDDDVKLIPIISRLNELEKRDLETRTEQKARSILFKSIEERLKEMEYNQRKDEK